MSEWNSTGDSSWGSPQPQNGGTMSSGTWGSAQPQNNYGSGSGGNWGSSRSPKETEPTYALSVTKLLAGLAGGTGGGILGWILLNGIRSEGGWTPLAFAAAVTSIAVCTAIAVRIAAGIDGSAKYQRQHDPKAHFGRRCLAFLAAVFLLSGVSEYLYELGGNAGTLQTSYIFVLDTSGSMSTGAGRAMEAAAEAVIHNLEPGFPFAVYTFSDKAERIIDLHPKSAEEDTLDLALRFSGSTALYSALSNISADYKSTVYTGNWSGGKAPKVLLFSDGFPTDGTLLGTEERSVLKTLRRSGLTVSTVSVDGADYSLMKNSARETGGVALQIADTADLRTAMERAFTESADRNLFSLRPVMANNWLYLLMRIAFLWILGALFAGVLYNAGYLKYDLDRAVISKLLTGLLGALAAELGAQTLRLPDAVICVLFGIFAGIAALHTVYVKPEKKPAEQFVPASWSGGSTPPDVGRREITDKNADGPKW